MQTEKMLCSQQFLLVLVILLHIANSDSQEPYGTIHCHSDLLDTKLLPDTTSLEDTTEFTFGDVQAICQKEDTTYIVTDNHQLEWSNGRSVGSPITVDNRCVLQRFEPPTNGLDPDYLHCESTDTGRPQYIFQLPAQGLFLQLPGTGSYLPQPDNAILTRAIDSYRSEVVNILVIARDARSVYVYEVAVFGATLRSTVELNQYCDQVSGITYQEPRDGRIIFIVHCTQNTEVKHYAVQLEDTLDLDTCNLLRFPSTPLSVVTSGDHVCMLEVSTLTCFVTTQPNRLPVIESFNGDIANAEFLKTADGAFLLVKVNGSQQVVFTVSPDGVGVRYSLPGSEAYCMDKCLPHLVIGNYLVLFKQNDNYYDANLYDLNSPLSAPTFRGKTRFEPQVVVFEFQQAPADTAPPTSDPPIPEHESTTDGGETTPTSPEQTTPTSPEQTTTPEETTTPTVSTDTPTSPESDPTAQPVIDKVALAVTISLLVLFVVAVLFAVLLLVLWYHRERKNHPENGYISCCSRRRHQKPIPNTDLEKIDGQYPLQENAEKSSPSISPSLSDRSSEGDGSPQPEGKSLMSTGDPRPAALVVTPAHKLKESSV